MGVLQFRVHMPSLRFCVADLPCNTSSPVVTICPHASTVSLRSAFYGFRTNLAVNSDYFLAQR
jgi:hypothetical protein